MAETHESREQRLTEILHAYLQALDVGQTPDQQDWLRLHPEFADELAAFFADQARLDAIAQPLRPAAPATNAPTMGYPTQPVEAAGTLIRYFGNYEILDEIARGGMGVVYRARQLSLERVVALKMILAGNLATEDEVRRFYAEAQTAAKLQHPNIVAIFDVGEHDGQHYFSMDYVEGRSLAEMVRTAPLAPQQAARYVKLVADVIHYAHQQGVLHRDLKPSNVLIDRLDQPRVTDFGLARSLASDKGLTATGAVVGTPSYMPPEQASAERGQMGPPSDVYSLGALLYELVTGRPPFRAATPLDTLMQVLTAEPAAPRLLNAAVDRDLETIILKCLAKESARRYQTAQALSEDLQAFLDGKPIKARRPSLAERGSRWLRQRRQSAKLSLMAAAVSALLLVAAFVGWRWYDGYRRGTFTLAPEGESYYEAEVFDDQGTQMLEPFTVPTRQPLSLPAGSYDIRLSGLHRLGQSVHLDLPRGTEGTYTVALNDQRLREPMPCAAPPLIVSIQGQANLFIPATADGMPRQRVSALSGQALWSADASKELLRSYRAPWAPHEVGDLDGDGVPDVLLADRQYPVLAVASGATGNLIWKHVGAHLRDDGRGPEEPLEPAGEAPDGQVTEPLLLDKSGDEPAVCLVVFHRPSQIHAKPTEIIRVQAQRWIEAVNLRTGKTVWRRTLDKENPDTFAKIPSIYTTLTQQGGKAVVTVAYGRRLVSLNARTGKPLFEPVDLGGLREIAARFANLTDDGDKALLWTTRVDPTTFQLSAFSTTTGRALWQNHPFDGTVPQGFNMETNHPRFPDWPLPIDAEGQGRCDVIVPCRLGNDQFGLEWLDGRTGETRWKRRVWQKEPVHSLIAGPALEGGRRDLYSAALQTDERQAFKRFLVVTAHASADGAILWQQRVEVAMPMYVEPLVWWKRDESGWPHLLVSVGQAVNQRTETRLFHGATGRFGGTLSGLRDLQTADLDGDGLNDLIGWQPGRLHLFRGGVPDAWRRFGTGVALTHDLDGDGVPDLLQGSFAVSGRTGRKLWTSAAPAPALPVPWSRGTAAADADLKGEGVPVVMAFQQAGFNDQPSPLKALSGKDGRVLWTAGDLALKMGSGKYITQYKWLASRRLSASAGPSVLFSCEEQWQGRNSLQLAALDGGTGKVLWRYALAPDQSGSFAFQELVPLLADLNGDGVLDVVTWAESSDGGMFEIHALDGRDGHLLWRHAVHATEFIIGVAPVFCLVPGAEGEPPDVLVRCYPSTERVELRLLDGRDGSPRWTWKQAELKGGPIHPDGFRRPVVVRFDARGEPLIAVKIESPPEVGLPTGKKQLWFLDREGKERGRMALDPETAQNSTAQLWTADLRGDGSEQLLFENGDEIHALSGPSGEHLWRHSLTKGVNGIERIVDILPSVNGDPATVVVHETVSQFVGLNGATGAATWRCDGDGKPVAVLPAADGRLPSVLYQHEGVIVCRRALPVDEKGRYHLPTPSADDYPPPIEDRANLRRLPWVLPALSLPGMMYLLFPGILACLWFVRRERRSVLALLLTLPVLTLIASVVWTLVDRRSFEEGEHYTWDSWGEPLSILALVSVILGLLTFAVYVVIALVNFVRGFMGGLRGK